MDEGEEIGETEINQATKEGKGGSVSLVETSMFCDSKRILIKLYFTKSTQENIEASSFNADKEDILNETSTIVSPTNK